MKRARILAIAITVLSAISISAIALAAPAEDSSSLISIARTYFGLRPADTPTADTPIIANSVQNRDDSRLAADQFFAGDGSALTAAKWGSSSSGPFTNAFTVGNIANFSTVNGTGSGAGGISVSGINATENFTLSSPSGTLLTGGTVIPVTVSLGKTLNFGSLSLSAAVGTGFVKNGDGTYFSSSSTTYSGGFTINQGTFVAGGINSMGAGGALTINGGTITSNASRDFTGKYAGGITFGGDFQLGALAGDVPLSNSAANLTFTNNVSAGSATRTITVGGNGTYTFAGSISGDPVTGLTIVRTGVRTGKVVLSGSNTYGGDLIVNGSEVFLSGPNTFTGKTIIANAGLLELLGASSIANTQEIEIAGGAAIDVQAVTTPVSLSSGHSLKASGSTLTGTIFGGGVVNGLTTASDSPILFTAFNGSTSPLTISGNAKLVLSATNPVTVTVSRGGIPLTAGDYKLIAKVSSGATGGVTGTPATVTVDGDGISGTASLVNINGELFLRVTAGTPVITVDTASTGFTGNFGDVFVGAISAEQHYKVSGDNIGGSIVVTAPAGFEVSPASGFTFSSSFSILGTGTIAPRDVFVRFRPIAAGPASGNVTNASTGATMINVPVSGNGTVPGTIQFDHATYSQDEFGSTAIVTVERTGGTGGPVSINYAATGGTATAGTCGTPGVDYQSASGTLTFNGTESSKTFSVTICNDSLWEPGGPESVNLALSAPTNGATLGTQASAVLNIIDDDTQPTLQFSASNYNVNENAGTALITVNRTGATENAVTVNYAANTGVAATAGTCGAFSGSDFEPVSSTLNFTPGTTSLSFSVVICNDGLFEPGNETFQIALNTPSVEAVLGTPNSGTVTIIPNNDPPTVAYTLASANADEASTPFVATVTRTGAIENSFSVNFGTDPFLGTATAGAGCGPGVDYVTTTGTLNFAPGDTSFPMNVPICDDADVEGAETFNATLSSPTGGAVLGTVSSQTITITDNDSAMNFSEAVFSGPESGIVTVTVTRNGDVSGSASVDYSTSDGTAAGGTCGMAGVDYQPASGTVAFGPGDTSGTFGITLCGDKVSEDPAETINVALNTPTNGGLGAQSTATVLVLDAATEFTNLTAVGFTDGLPGSLYPSTINVSGQPSSIAGVRVTLFNVTRPTMDDLSVLLVDPTGTRKFILMAGTGGPDPVSGATITLEDASADFLPSGAAFAEGQNYKPTNCSAGPIFPAPAPAGPFGDPGCGPAITATFASVFGGANPNGLWSLYMVDEPGGRPVKLGGPVSSIGGWGIQFLIPTAASVSVSGQIRQPNGVGIRNAQITVTGGNLAQPIIASTGSFGYFTVEGLTAGQAYVLSVNSRRHTFTPSVRAVQVFDDVIGFDFIADQ